MNIHLTPGALLAGRLRCLRLRSSLLRSGETCHEDADHHGARQQPKDRSRHWHDAIAATYFPLDLTFREPDRFSGEVTSWDLGNNVSLSRLTSEALRYQRLPHHFRAERDEHFLVTVPAQVGSVLLAVRQRRALQSGRLHS